MFRKVLVFLSVIFLFVGAGQTNIFASGNTETTIFAGGCFWCMESDFQDIPGVLDVVSGYIGGTGTNPNYGDYSKMGYLEAIKIKFDPTRITFARLLDLYWHSIDPLDKGGQFCDRGHQYTSAIFYLNPSQKALAEESKMALEKSGRLPGPVVTQIIKAGKFYPAEEYHQDYYKKNPVRYHFYRFRCGRDQRLKQLWGKQANNF